MPGSRNMDLALDKTSVKLIGIPTWLPSKSAPVDPSSTTVVPDAGPAALGPGSGKSAKQVPVLREADRRLLDDACSGRGAGAVSAGGGVSAKQVLIWANVRSWSPAGRQQRMPTVRGRGDPNLPLPSEWSPDRQSPARRRPLRTRSRWSSAPAAACRPSRFDLREADRRRRLDAGRSGRGADGAICWLDSRNVDLALARQ